MQIEKVYEPQRFEPHWAQWWIDSGIFRADPARTRGRVFSLVIPPPNVTGSLHMGHMLEHTEIDVTVRWHRMLGDNTLWLPGTDHAGIATQMVVERQLAEEGINYRDLGREEFEERVWEWKAQSGDTIKRQMIRLGASCDWSPRALHARPRPLPRRPRSLRPPLRKGPHLSRRVHGQLVPAAATPRSRDLEVDARRSRRAPLAHPLSGQRHARPLPDRRHHAPRNHARRYRRRHQSEGSRATSTCTARPSSCR